MATFSKAGLLFLLTVFYLTGTILAACGGDGGTCCVTSCPGGCVDGNGKPMCNECLVKCDLKVCTCGCFDTGLQYGGGHRGSVLGDTQAMMGLGVCGLMLLA